MTGQTDETGPDDPDDLLAAEYALGLLAAAEARAFEARLARDPGLRDRLDRWQAQFAQLAEGVTPEVPPAILRSQIERELFGRPVPLWRRMGLGLGPALLAATVVVVVVLAGIQLGWRAMVPPVAPFAAALTATEAVTAAPPGPVASIALDPAVGELTVRGLTLPPAPGHAHELWLIAEGAAPVSLGVVPPGPPVTLVLPEALRAAVRPGTLLAISDEPEGGSLTGQPAGPVLAAGAITASALSSGPPEAGAD